MSAFYLIFIILFTDNFGNKITMYRLPLIQAMTSYAHYVGYVPYAHMHGMSCVDIFLQVTLQVKSVWGRWAQYDQKASKHLSNPKFVKSQTRLKGIGHCPLSDYY